MGILDTVFSSRIALNGVELITRKLINFTGVGVAVEDDPENEQTNISLTTIAVGSHTAASVVGRSAATAGDAADIAAAADDRMLARLDGTLAFVQLTIGMIPALLITGAKIAANTITDAKLRQSAGVSVIGRGANSTGDVADITAGANDRVLARSSNALSFVQVATAMMADAAVTFAKLASDVTDMQYSTASSSRALAAGDYYKTLLVDATGGTRVITFPKNATLAIPVGANGYIRWNAGSNQVSVAAEDGTVTIDSSGSELKIARLKDQLYWEKTATNTFYVQGPKIP